MSHFFFDSIVELVPDLLVFSHRLHDPIITVGHICKEASFSALQIRGIEIISAEKTGHT